MGECGVERFYVSTADGYDAVAEPSFTAVRTVTI